MLGSFDDFLGWRVMEVKERVTQMKSPTKAELYAQVDALTKENIKLQDKLDAEERERWNALKDQAFEVCRNMIPFPNGIIQFLTLEHIDKAGYWFTFELINDSTKQTFCVRHTDL